jgi:hypothetical protein
MDTLPRAAPVIAKFADTEELKRERRKHRETMERPNTDLISSQTLSSSHRDNETALISPAQLSLQASAGRIAPGLNDTTNSLVPLASICSDDSSQPIFEQDMDNMSFNNCTTPCVTPGRSTTVSPGVMKYTHNPYAGRCFVVPPKL